MEENGKDSRKLYVGNLDWDVTEEQIRELFEKIGPIAEITVIPDRVHNRANKGFVFVTFEKEEDAQKAIEEYNESEQWGRPLKVNVAQPKKPRRDNYYQ